MYIYVASSWRNELQPGVVERLRSEGHEVYDFRNPSGDPGDCGFAWSGIERRWKDWTAEEYVRALDHPSAVSGFNADMLALLTCDACVLVQPCGLSAHLEFGHAVGAGKLGIVLVPGIREPELMLRMADRLCLTLDEVVGTLAAMTVRAGDVVHHRKCDETWVVAAVDTSRNFYACGWPETRAKLVDVDVIERVSDEAHLNVLRQVAASRRVHGEGSSRSACATRNLEAIEKATRG